MRRMSRVLLAAIAVMAVAAVPSMAQNSLDVNANAALNGTNFGLELMFEPGQANLAFVQDDSANGETVYRATWFMDMNNFACNNRTRNFFHINHGTYTAQPGVNLPIVRSTILCVDGVYAIGTGAWDNQLNQKGVSGCLVPASGEFEVQIEWTAGNAPTPGSLKLTTLESGVETCSNEAAGGIQNGAYTIELQSLLTLQEGGVSASTSIYVDEYQSFRTLQAM